MERALSLAGNHIILLPRHFTLVRCSRLVMIFPLLYLYLDSCYGDVEGSSSVSVLNIHSYLFSPVPSSKRGQVSFFFLFFF